MKWKTVAVCGGGVVIDIYGAAWGLCQGRKSETYLQFNSYYPRTYHQQHAQINPSSTSPSVGPFAISFHRGESTSGRCKQFLFNLTVSRLNYMRINSGRELTRKRIRVSLNIFLKSSVPFYPILPYTHRFNALVLFYLPIRNWLNGKAI